MMMCLIELIDSKIKGKWGPEQILGWIHENTLFNISHETIYQIESTIDIYCEQLKLNCRWQFKLETLFYIYSQYI